MVAPQPTPDAIAQTVPMSFPDTDPAYRGVFLLEDVDAPANAHDHAGRRELARRAAALLGVPVLDAPPRPGDDGPPVLVIPSETIEWSTATLAGVAGADTLLGGAVPACFVGTKAIVHPLIDADAARPAGWSGALAPAMAGAALSGFAAFSRADAARAGRRLLERGPVRVKETRAKAGLGQVVVRDAETFDAVLAAQDEAELAAVGVVLEENLADVRTFSVGATDLGDHRIAYWGTQNLVRDHQGREVYGGTDLYAVRGNFDNLAAIDLPPVVARAVACAAAFDAAARAAYPDLLVTRRNYDVIEGTDALGDHRVAVLEQSWRIGGASPAELAAMAALADDPARPFACASSVEIYADVVPPPDAIVYFRGVDPVVGPMTKYAEVRA